MPRRKSTGGTTHVGDVLPPPPAIPVPQKTEAELAHERAQNAEITRRLIEINDALMQQNLDRAVRLAQMAARRQGPLVDFFEKVGLQYYKLADEGPQKPSFKVIWGGAAERRG
jgi:hypothetical protein